MGRKAMVIFSPSRRFGEYDSRNLLLLLLVGRALVYAAAAVSDIRIFE